MEFKMIEKPEWGPLATFIPNKDEPIYNWFYYKEGFAKELVLRLAEMFQLRKGSMAGRRQGDNAETPSVQVLDPFCGVGTTLLACRQLGLNSIGFDVHPVAVFASKVKTRDYDPEILKQEIKSLIKAKFSRPTKLPDSGIVRRVFPRHILEDAVFFRDTILERSSHHGMKVAEPPSSGNATSNGHISSEVRDFLTLGLMSVAIKCSYACKDGAVIKVRKKPTPPLRDMLRRQLFRMLRDVQNFKAVDGEKASRDAFQPMACETFADFGDSRALPLESESVDCIITSPPYLNKIEYTKIYEIEHELFLRHVQETPGLRSYIGLSLSRLEKDSSRLEKALDYETVQQLPMEALPYLVDMFQSIEEMHRVCRKGAKLGIVVGNGCFPTCTVDSDILLSRMAESLGFTVQKILVLNKRWCTKNRTEKVGIIRESLLLWEKT
jgi:DNA modification methylase